MIKEEKEILKANPSPHRTNRTHYEPLAGVPSLPSSTASTALASAAEASCGSEVRINEAESGSGSVADGESGICAGAKEEDEVEREGECGERGACEWVFEEEDVGGWGCGWCEERLKGDGDGDEDGEDDIVLR